MFNWQPLVYPRPAGSASAEIPCVWQCVAHDLHHHFVRLRFSRRMPLFNRNAWGGFLHYGTAYDPHVGQRRYDISLRFALLDPPTGHVRYTAVARQPLPSHGFSAPQAPATGTDAELQHQNVLHDALSVRPPRNLPPRQNVVSRQLCASHRVCLQTYLLTSDTPTSGLSMGRMGQRWSKMAPKPSRCSMVCGALGRKLCAPAGSGLNHGGYCWGLFGSRRYADDRFVEVRRHARRCVGQHHGLRHRHRCCHRRALRLLHSGLAFGHRAGLRAVFLNVSGVGHMGCADCTGRATHLFGPSVNAAMDSCTLWTAARRPAGIWLTVDWLIAGDFVSGTPSVASD